MAFGVKPDSTILLYGELGAGKTRMAKGIVSAALGVPEDDIVSPTFTLVNRYDGEFPLMHVDLYRCSDTGAEDLGLWDELDDAVALIVEWPEALSSKAEDPLIIFINYTENDDRRIRLEYDSQGAWPARLAKALAGKIHPDIREFAPPA